MLNVVIFSKDRGMQLEALLRSYKTSFKEWRECNTSIVYTCSAGGVTENPIYQGYQHCKKLHPEFRYKPEPMYLNFKDAVLTSIDPNLPYTMFLVDDILFKDEFSTTDKAFSVFMSEEAALCLSLRLYDGIDYCYPTNSSVKPPKSMTDGVWSWQGHDGDWGYPMSVDGHVFRTPILRRITEILNFHSPNSFEGAMASMSWQLAGAFPYMVCYRNSSKLLNIPANRVQNEVANRVADLSSAQELNQLFLDGKLIDINVVRGHRNKAPHEPIPYQFIETANV